MDEVMVSIATGTHKPLHLAPSVATVITAQDIKETGARYLREVLVDVPGLHLAHSWNRFNTLYTIRGIRTDFGAQTLILLNGTTLDDAFNGGLPALYRLGVANISRIEIEYK